MIHEINFHIKADLFKQQLKNSYDFTLKGAFTAIDDWSYGYLDFRNLKAFLQKIGYIATKRELVCILRRLDTDGDGRISYEEF